MIGRTNRKTMKFGNPFVIERGGRLLPAGAYEVLTDEELVEGLSFPVYRRVATMMLVPAPSGGAIEMLTVDPAALAAAVARDIAATDVPAASVKAL